MVRPACNAYAGGFYTQAPYEQIIYRAAQTMGAGVRLKWYFGESCRAGHLVQKSAAFETPRIEISAQKYGAAII